MAETTIDLRGVPAAEAYAELRGHVEAVLEGIDDDIAAMATVSALIHNSFGHLWTGFYRVVEPGRLLRIRGRWAAWRSSSVAAYAGLQPLKREQ